MINTTDSIKIVDEVLLIKHFKETVEEIKILIDSKIEDKKTKNKRSFIEKVNIENLIISTDNIEILFEFATKRKSKSPCIELNILDSFTLLEEPYIRNGFKLVFLSLWKKGVVLLPFQFEHNIQGFDNEIINSFDDKTIKDFCVFFEKKDKSAFSKSFIRNYINKIKKIIRTGKYNNLKDIKINYINQLHISILDSRQGLNNYDFPNGSYYMEQFLADLKFINSDFNYDAFDYRRWLLGFYTRYKRFDYLSYLENKDGLKERRRVININQTKERNKIKNPTKITNKINKSNKKDEIETLTIEKEFLNIIRKQNSWKENIPVYEGYHFDDLNKSKQWQELFVHYLEHRKKQGYESTKSIISNVNYFLNYLFFYLNLWNEKNEKEITIPYNLKDFHRTLFIKNTNLSLDEKRPLTLIEILDYQGKSPNLKNSLFNNVKGFFEFIDDMYMDEDLVNKNFVNSIRKSDFYRTYKNKKTDKVIIPKNIYGKLKKYLSTLEYFGEHLEKNKLILEDKFRDQNLINSSEYGFIPVFFDKGKAYPIFDVPNTLLFKNRTYQDSNSGKVITKSIISNTVIRAFILMLNTGLRAAQVEWLDRRTWNKYEPDDIEKAYYKLNVNTDKTKNSEWMSYVSNSVYQSLQKETAFQNSMRENFIDLEVNYQGREYSRFENIIPLFKSDSPQGKPIDFRKSWVEILWQFQNILNETENESYELITITKPRTQKIEYFGDDRLKYSPLNIKAVHTPHSMRATFCTHMSEYLERSEIAALVGHSSELITSDVYIKPEDQTLIDKIDKANNLLDNGVNSGYFSKDNEAHIKPQLKNSSLQKAFSEDREQAIALFNISSISLDINKDSEEQSKKAIGLLKDARMDQVIFDTTHICPVGGVCPLEVMGAIKEKRRCGLCPLALKTIDNINPIYAKQRDLIRLIKEGKEELDIAIKDNESEIKIVSIEDCINLDIRELVSWRFSAEVLSKHYEQIKDDKTLEKKFFVEMPDMVKSHLEKVSVSSEKEYLLTRIADSNAYSAYGNTSNKYQADTLKRHIVKNLSLFELEDYNVGENEKIEFFCSMIKNMLDSNGIGLKNLVEYDVIKSIEKKKEKAQSFLVNKEIKLLK